MPRLLFVVVMPENEADWACQTDSELVLRCQGFWKSLSGMPATEAATTVTVHLPRTNVIDAGQLALLMDRANRGEEL